MLRADQKYHGKVTPGSQLYETQTGTIGYQVMLECEDGATDFTIWLTEKNRDRAIKYFQILGINPDNLKDQNYLELELAREIEGREVVFGTKDEEYQGKHRIKVAWIGKATSGDALASATKFFGGTPKAFKATEGVHPSINDDDIPF